MSSDIPDGACSFSVGTMYTNILIPTDGLELAGKAIEHGIALANNGKLPIALDKRGANLPEIFNRLTATKLSAHPDCMMPREPKAFVTDGAVA